MKNLLLAFLALPAALFAQDAGFHRHDGFFLSLSPGVAFGGTELDPNGAGPGFDNVTFRGPGTIGDIKIGGAIRENLILSFDMISRTIPGPDVEVGGGTFETDEDFSITDGSIGLGVTYYFMPANVFLSGTVGAGRFTLRNAGDDDQFDSDAGLSLHLKIGKEWWVSKNWGLGVAAGFGFIGAEASESSDADYNGDYASNKLYVLFNTTFN